MPGVILPDKTFDQKVACVLQDILERTDVMIVLCIFRHYDQDIHYAILCADFGTVYSLLVAWCSEWKRVVTWAADVRSRYFLSNDIGFNSCISR